MNDKISDGFVLASNGGYRSMPLALDEVVDMAALYFYPGLREVKHSISKGLLYVPMPVILQLVKAAVWQ